MKNANFGIRGNKRGISQLACILWYWAGCFQLIANTKSIVEIVENLWPRIRSKLSESVYERYKA